MQDSALFEALQALQEGAQDYLVKGQIETRGLLRALRYAIGRKIVEKGLSSSGSPAACSASARPCSYRLGPLVTNPQRAAPAPSAAVELGCDRLDSIAPCRIRRRFARSPRR